MTNDLYGFNNEVNLNDESRFQQHLESMTPASFLEVASLLKGIEKCKVLKRTGLRVKHCFRSLLAAAPVLCGESVIGCWVVGPILLHNVIAPNGELITGCGAIVFDMPTRIPSGIMVELRGGSIITRVEDLKPFIVGWNQKAGQDPMMN